MATDNDNKDEIINVRELLQEYASKWYLFVACIVVCTALAFLYTRTSPPVYQVKANILISQDDAKGASSLMSKFGDIANMFGSKGDVDDEVFIVASHSVLRDAIKELGINKMHYVSPNLLQTVFKYRDYPVDVLCDPAIMDTLMVSIRFKVKVSKEGEVNVKAICRGDKIAEVEDGRFPVAVETPYGKFMVNKTRYFKPGEKLKTSITLAGYNVAAEKLSRETEIFVSNKRANAITLSTTTVNTEYGKDILNTIIAKYNERGINDRNTKSQKTAEFIDSRLALLTGDLNDTEKDIENFKKEQGMTDLTADVTYVLGKKGSVEQELIKAESNAAIMKMLREFIDNPDNAYSLMPSTPAIFEVQEAITAYNNVVLQRIDLARNAKGNSLPLKKIDDQLDALRNNLRTSLAKSQQSAQLSVRELQNEINSTDSRLGQMPYQERVYRSIMRQQAVKEELYLFLLQRREETSMTLANSVPKGIIVDNAYSLSEPKGLSNKMWVLIGAIFGLVLAPTILYVRRSLRNKFETKDELERLTKVPLLGEVCTSRSGQALVVKPGSTSSVVELFRLIRTNLQFILNGKDDKVILMTSTVSGEGKSFISINLASSLALLGNKVLLVGMDIRAPKLAEYLPLQPKHGLTEYLSTDTIALDDIIIPDAVLEGMDIIAAGPVPPNPGELLLSQRVDELFAKLRTMYDYIVVDSAPVGMVSDTFSLTRVSDATVYVCRANYTTLRDVKFFNDIYTENRLKKMSLVVNGTNARKGYGYGYGHDVDRNGKHRKSKKK